MGMSDYLRKTVKVKLDVNEDEKDKLLETFRQFNKACNEVVKAGWDENGDKNYNKMELHQETYRDIKGELDLTANLVCSARNRAAEAIKRVVQDWSNGKKASKPEFDEYSSILYDKRSATIKDRYCTLSTVNSRIKAEYILGEYQKKHLDDKNYEFRSCTLNYEEDKEEFYLHITIRKPVLYKNEGNVLGVDLGIKNIAVTSTGRFLGKDMRWRKNHFFRVRKGLQGKGTQSAMRTLKDMAGRENRYTEDKLHNISRKLVEEAEKHNCNRIAFEDLKEIRDKDEKFDSRLERQLHSWAFEKLQKFTEYKAKEKGIEVLRVESEYTSQTCSKCGHTEKNNRKGSQFKCKECGYVVNADYNAAKNIGLRALPSDKSSDGLSHGQLALKSGMLNPTAV